MDQGEAQQTEAEPGVLDYAPPRQRGTILPFLIWGLSLASLYFILWLPVYWTWWSQPSPLRTALMVAFNLPMVLASRLLGHLGMHEGSFYSLYYVIAQSVIYGFTLATFIHWLKRWRLRRI